jgi:hypothetical protein
MASSKADELIRGPQSTAMPAAEAFVQQATLFELLRRNLVAHTLFLQS